MHLQRRTLVKAAGACALLGAHLPRAFAADERYEWRSVPYGAGGFVDGFLFHPTERGLLYARTDIGGAYRFDEAAQSWIPLLDHLDRADADLMGVLSLAVDPHDPDRLYAACGLYLDEGTRPGALLASADRGASWQVHELGIHLGGNWYGRASGERLQVDPRDGKVLWLGTTQNGLLKSTDGGRTFGPAGLPARHVSMVLIDAERGAIYAGSHDDPGLYVSHDNGRRFFPVPETPAQPPQHAALGPDGSLYVSFAQGDAPQACNPSLARRGGVWKRSVDGHWSEVTPQPAVGFGYSAVDVHPGGRVVVSTIDRHTEGDEIFMSDDAGRHWTPVGKRSQHDATGYPWLQDYMRTERNLGHWTSSVRLDPFDADRALYGTGYGVWMTRDLGAAAARDGSGVHWRFTVANFEETATLEIRSPAHGPRLLAAVGDIAGGAWEDPSRPLGTGFFTPTKETNRSIDFAELAPHIIARTGDHAGGYWTGDGGATWHVFDNLHHDEDSDKEAIAVSARGGAFVHAPEHGPARWSHDHGKTWAPCRGWPKGDDFLKPVADRAAEGVFYVHDRAGGRILVSTDGGREFRPMLADLPRLEHEQQASHLVSAPGAAGDLWLALDDRLLHLPGRDRPARRIEGVAQAWMLALGKGLPQGAYRHSLYLWGRVHQGAEAAGAAVEGLFRSDDGGASFVRINDDAHRYGRLLCMAGDAREHGVLYIAPHGRGIVTGRPRRPQST